MGKRPQNITTTDNKLSDGLFFTYSSVDQNGNIIVNPEAAQKSFQSLRALEGIHTSIAARDTWKGIDTNISVREEFTRGDYTYFRPSEAIPQRQQEIIGFCMEAYRKVGIVRNVIDLMGDFGSQGITLNHPNPKIQAFYRKWFEKVNGADRSERFLNLFYRCSNVFIQRKLARFGNKLTALAKNDLKADTKKPTNLKIAKGTIPIEYIFINPLTLETICGEISQFVGKIIYALKLPHSLSKIIKFPKTAIEKALVANIPEDIKKAALSQNKLYPLDNHKIASYFYKKDDWQIWADPMIRAILDDLLLLEKMKLADLAALDGVISQIRVWKLGHINDAHPEASLFPTDVAIGKLRDILLSNPGGGVFDLIWGPDIKLDNITTDVHQFLGMEKYQPTLNSIYEGLGVPPTLTGSSSGGGGLTNNSISLKTLIQRLEYGRTALMNFWAYEIELVRQAMGFKLPATISFDRMILNDEAAEKALLIQLADRNLISTESLQKRIGEIPELERLRMKREIEMQKKKETAPKVGPFQPDKEYELIKSSLVQGLITPYQAGVDLDEDVFEKPPILLQLDKTNVELDATNKGQPQQGRPKLAKDKQKRDPRTPKALGENLDEVAWFLTTLTWAKRAQKEIADLMNPAMLSIAKKDNLRQLTDDETNYLENVKFLVLSQCVPFCKVDDNLVYKILEGNTVLSTEFKTLYDSLKQTTENKFEKSLNFDELRHIQAITYALLLGDKNG